VGKYFAKTAYFETEIYICLTYNLKIPVPVKKHISEINCWGV
jgi:hypothetical protein